jgi:phosphatidate cytidylyltransferase
MKTLYTRSVTAAIFVIVMLGAVLWSPASFFLLFVVIAVGGMREYFQLMEKIDPEYRMVSPWHRPCVYLLVPSVFLALSGKHFQFLYLPAEFLGLWLGAMLILIILVNEGLFMDRLRVKNLRHSLVGLLYVALPLGLMVNMRFDDSVGRVPVLVLGIIGSLWINDTMAYLVGWQIGKTPFFPAISPKKTWEGTIGGVVLTLVVAALYGYYGHAYYPVGQWIAIAATAAIFGTAGDLLESKIKRLAGVKDSGTLMPGHGGILDRFDSMLIAAPAVWLYAAFFLH